MQNYAKIQARDQQGEIMIGPPVPFVALATNTFENVTVSSVTNLNPNTTVIEVAAVGALAAIKWTPATSTPSVVTAVAGANYDNVIPAGEVRQFVVPRNTQARSDSYTSFVGLNIREGLYTAVAIKGGIGSVLLTQY